VHGIDKNGRESIVKFCTQCEDLHRTRHNASAAERQAKRDEQYLKAKTP
jgi:hypothetical protein